MNPPRRGVPRTVRDALLVERPATLVYVSCDPDTLARDVAPFVEAGYTISEFSPFDQIPLTDEVETIVVLERGAETQEQPASTEASSAIVTRLIGSHSRAASKLPRRFAPDGGTSGVALYGAPLTVEGVTALVLVRGVTHGKGKLVARVAVGGHTARNGGGKGREMREVHAQYVRLAVLPKAKESSKYLGKKGGHSLLLVTTAGWTPKQIFAQALAIGHPVIGRPVRLEGDPEATDRHFEERYTLDRPFVHIARVSFRDGDGASHTVNAPLAGDLTTVLLRLGAAPEELSAAPPTPPLADAAADDAATDAATDADDATTDASDAAVVADDAATDATTAADASDAAVVADAAASDAALFDGGALSDAAPADAASADSGLACAPGLQRCGEACVDLATDVRHCGACDRACVFAGGASACIAGACARLVQRGQGQLRRLPRQRLRDRHEQFVDQLWRVWERMRRRSPVRCRHLRLSGDHRFPKGESGDLPFYSDKESAEFLGLIARGEQ
ncbi:hypothetical protein OUZ56_032549 [Daphnia magna]|uniref:tRNA (uracil(54)-C(5))-methyltransferase n=1 Tax=Daphnia magna TaxID=35525 RepID=A0ABR0B983_9CRUS|nr:hypothetical protein OUZ56_032549 [Daphnia magna]